VAAELKRQVSHFQRVGSQQQESVMSKKFLVPLALLGVLAVSGSAFAADQATGEIKTLNAANHQLTLSDGQKFSVTKDVNLRDFEIGQTVDVTYDIKNGRKMASSIDETEPEVFKDNEQGGHHDSGRR
jgi:Protein of unknown function (DUF1344)